jgi:hypothetical protein
MPVSAGRLVVECRVENVLFDRLGCSGREVTAAMGCAAAGCVERWRKSRLRARPAAVAPHGVLSHSVEKLLAEVGVLQEFVTDLLPVGVGVGADLGEQRLAFVILHHDAPGSPRRRADALGGGERHRIAALTSREKGVVGRVEGLLSVLIGRVFEALRHRGLLQVAHDLGARGAFPGVGIGEDVRLFGLLLLLALLIAAAFQKLDFGFQGAQALALGITLGFGSPTGFRFLAQPAWRHAAAILLAILATVATFGLGGVLALRGMGLSVFA